LALTLASASPQRRTILDQLGVPYEARPVEVAELAEGDPGDLVVENALRKARAADGDPVLGADTVVALGERVLGKPAGEAEARGFLADLSGATHEVWSGVALINGDTERTAAARTAVRFRALSDADVEGYLATGEWRGRAGGYAIQGRGAALVESIDGDYFNVVGLPVAALVELAPALFGPAHETARLRRG
jgi:septum formation protein